MNCRGEKEGADGNLVENPGECFELKSKPKKGFQEQGVAHSAECCCEGGMSENWEADLICTNKRKGESE